MGIFSIGLGKALPLHQITNADLSRTLDTSDEWIVSHTGIHSRYIAEPSITTASLASQAAREAIEQARISADDIGCIICATATGDYTGFPSTACIVQAQLGASNAFAFDISAACSGFVYALEVASSLMKAQKMQYTLVIGVEILSRKLDWSDRSTCVLFGDGAGAVVLKNDDMCGRGIMSTILGSDGNGAKELFIDDKNHIVMNGRAVYTFAVKIIPNLIEELLRKESLTLSDINKIVCHQANERILQAAVKRLSDMTGIACPDDKFVYNMAMYGNTSAASIPITLYDMQKNGELQEGMLLILAGFGAGLTYGGCIIRW